jgi:hypothetical protein
MTNAGPSRGGGSDPGGPVVMSAGRGAVLVILAVVVGLLVFAVVDDRQSPSTSTAVTTPTVPATNPDGTPATTVTTAPTTTTKPSTSTTKAKKSTSTTAAGARGARPNDQVVVQVLNGSGIQGAATQRSNDLKAKAYQVLGAGNAPAQRTGNAVMCAAGFEKEGQALVATLQTLGVNAAVEALPSPIPAGFDTAANCYVLLGK